MKENLNSHALGRLLLKGSDKVVKIKVWNHDCCESWQEIHKNIKYYIEDNVFIIEEVSDE